MEFVLQKKSGLARRGQISLAHGVVETPAFMPVGTYGTVKAMSPLELHEIGAHIVLGNTFHLWLRPGPDVVSGQGGLHGFTRWPHAMLTDSGGFQAFSLGGNAGSRAPGAAVAPGVRNSMAMLMPPNRPIEVLLMPDSVSQMASVPAVSGSGNPLANPSARSAGMGRANHSLCRIFSQ